MDLRFGGAQVLLPPWTRDGQLPKGKDAAEQKNISE